MRGFRGNRAAQSFNSRSNREPHIPKQGHDQRFLHLVQHPTEQNRPSLPDWLKTPETREREKKNQTARPNLNLVPKPPVEKAAAPAEAAKKVSTKHRKPAAKKPTTKKKAS